MTRVLVGISGGVDSAVAAFLLKQEGYEVVGITMTLFTPKEESNQINDAKKVCEKLNIEHHIINFQDEFNNEIINNFISEYLEGNTPNPCIICNKKFKFGRLWEKAQELNCEYIATGHYANIVDNKICRINSPKDQSYFLYNINKDVIPHILLPLNKFSTKEEIREIARKEKLVEVSDKKDSQDICFIEEQDYSKFLEENLSTLPPKGNFVLKTGEVIGQHKGIIYYTIGQRKGLGISYKHPLYVIKIDKEKNEVILGREEDLYSTIVNITNTNILVDKLPQQSLAKIRYRSKLYPCQFNIIDDNNIEVKFSEPVKSATPGQSLVIYDNDILVGGGIIKDFK